MKVLIVSEEGESTAVLFGKWAKLLNNSLNHSRLSFVFNSVASI